jgi:serine/threonine-protein kinase
VPTLIGASERAARRRLEENSFALERLSEIESRRYPTDAVVAQEPPPAGRGQAVSLLINRGERGPTYVMPDLIGVDGTLAADILRGRGFRVTVVGEHPYAGLPPGVVLRQSPQAGFQIAPGEPISLEVSR